MIVNTGLNIHSGISKDVPADRKIDSGDRKIDPADLKFDPGDGKIVPADRKIAPGDGKFDPADLKFDSGDGKIVPADRKIAPGDCIIYCCFHIPDIYSSERFHNILNSSTTKSGQKGMPKTGINWHKLT